jgi:thiamine biosynthesis protein ThiC
MSLETRITSVIGHIATMMKAMASAIDKKANKENWFTLVSGFLLVEKLPDIATGRVIKYTYPGGGIRYRFIANDKSEDSFYTTFSNGVLTGLIATKKITV